MNPVSRKTSRDISHSVNKILKRRALLDHWLEFFLVRDVFLKKANAVMAVELHISSVNGFLVHERSAILFYTLSELMQITENQNGFNEGKPFKIGATAFL